jgi:hypothetical protein
MLTRFWFEPRLISTRNAAIAWGAAVLADFAQVPATLAALSGVLSFEAVALDGMIDVGMTVLTTSLLGFHVALLPTMLIEAIPVIDVAPTWTACVSYVLWARRRQIVTAQR